LLWARTLHGVAQGSQYMTVDVSAKSLVSDLMAGKITRRQAMAMATAAGLSLPAFSMIAAVPGVAAQATPAADVTTGGVLRVGLAADPAELDPHLTSLTAAWHVIEHVYEGLVSYDASLAPIPALAESWDVAEDGLTYTFNLRQGVMFHNGREFTADDVVYSFERIINPETASPHSSDFGNVVSIEAADPATAVFTLTGPDASFLAKLMGSSMAIVPQDAVEENGDLMNIMVGTGPFQFVEYIPNSSVTLERNPNYWDAPLPYLDGLELIVAIEPTSRRTALVSNTVDFIEYAPVQDMPIFESDDSIQIFGNENTNIRYMGINVEREPFNIPEVRQAIAMVIDRGPIIDSAVFGGGAETITIFPPNFWAGYETEIPAPDIEGAQALLAEAGYPDGFETTIHSWAQYPFLSNAALVIQEQLKAIGIEADTDFQENAIYLENYFAGNFDLSVTGTSAYVDPNDVIEGNFHSNRTNIATGYANPEVDALIEAGIATTDQEERAGIYQQIQEILLEDLPWINLFIAAQYEAAKDYVQGYEHIATGTNKSIRSVWLDQ
jgi:peptide/nickel transport system substrate-binding protein